MRNRQARKRTFVKEDDDDDDNERSITRLAFMSTTKWWWLFVSLENIYIYERQQIMSPFLRQNINIIYKFLVFVKHHETMLFLYFDLRNWIFDEQKEFCYNIFSSLNSNSTLNRKSPKSFSSLLDEKLKNFIFFSDVIFRVCEHRLHVFIISKRILMVY